MITLLLVALAGCSPAPSSAPTSSASPGATSTPLATSATAAPSPAQTQASFVLEPSGEPLGDPMLTGLLVAPDGFLATGWTSDFSAAVIATGAADGRSWVPLDATRAFATPLASIAVGPHGWVATEQVDSSSGAGTRMFWSADGHAWERLPDQAGLDRSFPGPIASGPWGYAMLGQAIDANGTSYPAVWVSRDGKAWTQTPATGDELLQVVVVVESGVLALGYQKAFFSRDGATWVDVAPVPGIESASSVTATAAGGSDALVALTSDLSPTFLRGHVDSSGAADVVEWTDAGLALPAHSSVSGFAVGPLGAIVLGFDRRNLHPESWVTLSGGAWQRADLDDDTFGGGAPGLVAAGDRAFVALGSQVNDLGLARTRAWVSTDGLHWQRANTDALGAFPPPPADPCPTADPTNVQVLLDMAATDPLTGGAAWPLCFGRRELTFRAYVHDCGGCGGVSTYEARPAWLLDSLGYAAFWLDTKPGHGATPLAVQVDPTHTVRTPRSGAHVRITGHFDDPAATSCRLVPTIAVITELPAPGVAIGTCRKEFVVTSIKLLAG